VQLTCPACGKVVDFSGERPGFCPFCGRPLPKQGDIGETLTGAWRGSTDMHVAPGGGAAAPRAVGEYRLLRELGHGGMGVVWEAEQAATGRRVAVKLLSPRVPHTGETIDRFLREARLAASLSHPRTTFVFGAGQDEGRPYIAMELMPGRTLKDVIEAQGGLPISQAVDHILDVIEGLEAAHALGIIHRDVKPSNCFLDADGRVKVGDFGLSKSLVGDSGLTRTGAFLGTPQFASPEQVRGGAIDPRTDVYAVGATLYYLLTGRGPFEGDAAAVIARIASDPAPGARALRADVPKPLDRIIARTLDKDPARRPATLAELGQALRPYATGGSSIADIGRRLAAYMLDQTGAGLIGAAGGLAVQFVHWPALTSLPGEDAMESSRAFLESQIGAQWFASLVPILYFALCEGIWTRTPGKWLMGLRVEGPSGLPPGPGRSLLRACVLPGALGLALLGPIYLMNRLHDPRSAETGLSLVDFFFTTLTAAPAYLFALLCLTTMRKRNGFRGLHELISGTRTVRLATASQRSRAAHAKVVAAVADQSRDEAFGPFKTLGELGRLGGARAVLAHDARLDREAWILVRETGDLPASERHRIARPARPRWLQGGDLNGQRWDAFEAIRGVPLPAVMGGLPWDQARHTLSDLADELSAAADDNTLPGGLDIEQVWIDVAGHARLLDAKLLPTDGPDPPRPQTSQATPVERAVALLRTAIERLTRGQVLPGHAQRIVEGLSDRLADRATLTWAAAELRASTMESAGLRWDDRLGMMAVSLGTEMNLFASLAFALPFAVFYWGGGPGLATAAVSLALLLFLPLVLGFAFRGGPVFRFLGIEVCRPDGRPAGRFRCAWRAFVAWTPWLVFQGGLGLIVATMAVSVYFPGWTNATAPIVAPNLDADGRLVGVSLPGAGPGQMLIISLVCGAELFLLLFIVGVVVGIVSPRRGLQDMMSGTCLAPK
jgi:uncharacterized RDD family membrane protein YckC